MGGRDWRELPLATLVSRHARVGEFLESLGFAKIPPQCTLGDWLERLSDEAISDAGLARQQILDLVDDLLARLASLEEDGSAGIVELTIVGGHDKSGGAENVELKLARGDIVCLVGPTGAGKSRLLADIECLAQRDTPSGRQILVEGEPAAAALRFSPRRRLVAQLSQNMNFVVDMDVGSFIAMHARCRHVADEGEAVGRVLACANELTGERFAATSPLTQLSGGQTRALMIADAALLSASPIVLIDEIENAGVDRKRALQLLVAGDKIVLISTHDPLLALYGGRRCVIRNGAIRDVFATSAAERAKLARLEALDAHLMDLRDRLRRGERIEEELEWLR